MLGVDHPVALDVARFVTGTKNRLRTRDDIDHDLDGWGGVIRFVRAVRGAAETAEPPTLGHRFHGIGASLINGAGIVATDSTGQVGQARVEGRARFGGDNAVDFGGAVTERDHIAVTPVLAPLSL